MKPQLILGDIIALPHGNSEDLELLYQVHHVTITEIFADALGDYFDCKSITHETKYRFVSRTIPTTAKLKPMDAL